MKGIKKTRKTIFKKKSLYGIIFAIIILSIIFIYSSQHSPLNPTINQTFQFKAAIVDQLSLTAPNQTFIETATNTLKQAGYTVDYYPSENVTVDFYRNLATLRYEIIVFRVHSTATNPDGSRGPVTFFTSQRYDKTRYLYEQLTDQLVAVTYSQDEWERGIIYFGINPPFITHSLNGRFPDTTIIMMGCEGLNNSLMAKAFVEKGAKAYISWDKPVLASYTDTATACLLKQLTIENQTISQATFNTMMAVGLDPVHNSILGYYPSTIGNQTIETIINKN